MPERSCALAIISIPDVVYPVPMTDGDEERPPVPATVLGFERSVRLNTYEQGEVVAIFSSAGEHIRTYCGHGWAVIPEDDRPLIAGQILSHNHPGDTAFSKNDLAMAADYRLREIRVVGASARWTMRPGRRGWPAPGAIRGRYGGLERSAGIADAVEGRLLSMSVSFSPAERYAVSLRIRSELCCKKIADEFGLVFRIERWQRE
ncbi:hypothetical protein [Methanofollis fontis]|uniref:Uncharacterized protein n=1 Tax=Methanofollis fontis TaxID=2052832 RepID=A0A483CU13_9EURY|nr:hypothetical protein [Methanofollis fontis]TAJ44774.1 hypothetical protein CUJ86_05625 [Methanofollis fontis]